MIMPWAASDFPAFTYAQDLALLADHKDVCLQDLAHDPADVVEDDLSCIIVVNQLFNFSCVVQQNDISCCVQSIQYFYLLLTEQYYGEMSTVSAVIPSV